MTDKEEIKFAIRYLKKGLKSKRTPPLYEELMNELGFEKKVNNLSCVAVDFFTENYPEYVTEKGECLSPYWDLFSAGVICATFELNNKIAELKAYNEKLLDGDIEKHNKIVELQAQIEKMKCCGNCAKRGHICVAEEMQGNLCGKNKVKWELRR